MMRLRPISAEALFCNPDQIEEYLVPVVYPTALTRELQLWLGGALIAFNALIYAILWRRFRGQR